MSSSALVGLRRGLVALASWVVALSFGCGGADSGSGDARDAASSSHRRMVAALAEIAERTPDENKYLGDKLLRDIRAAIAAHDPAQGPRSLWELEYKAGIIALRLGDERPGLEHLERAIALLPRTIGEISQQQAVESIFETGVAYLRLGESENCCARASAASCILPIQGEAVHTREEGSTKAIAYFTKVIESTTEGVPEHDHAIWLLNVAYMTLGRYPEGVPERYRISPDAFRAKIPFPRFENVAAVAGVNTFNLSGGAILDDFDGDGDPDLLTSTWNTRGQIRYFRNDGDGRFTDRTEAAGSSGILGGLNLVQADHDNDGDLDLLVLRGAWLGRGGRHPNSLLEGRGDGTFEDVTFDAGLGHVHFPTQTAAWADYDLDGDLDLYIGNETTPELDAPCQLFRNRGDGTFEDIAESAGVTKR